MATWWNDYKNNVLQGLSIFVQNNDTEIFGLAVDMKEAEVGLHAQLHTLAIIDGTHTIRLQESADGSTGWTDIVDFITGGTAQFGVLTSGGQDDSQNRTLNFKRSKRFVRAAAAAVGATSGGTYSVAIHGMRKAINE